MEPLDPLDVQSLRLDADRKQADYHKSKHAGSGFFVILTAWIEMILAKVDCWFPQRVLNLFLQQNGAVMAAGIAFYFFFSGIAALSGTLVIFGIFLTKDLDLQGKLIQAISELAPGLIKTADHPNGLIVSETLLQNQPLSFAAFVSLGITLFTGINMLAYLRLGVRAMFKEKPSTTSYFLQILQDGVGLVLFGGLFIISSCVSMVTVNFLSILLDFLSLNAEIKMFVVHCIGFGVTFLLDVGILLLTVYFVADIKVKWVASCGGALVGATAISILRILGTSAVSGVISSYPALSPFAVPLILLLWFNVLCTIILLACALMKVLSTHSVAVR